MYICMYNRMQHEKHRWQLGEDGGNKNFQSAVTKDTSGFDEISRKERGSVASFWFTVVSQIADSNPLLYN